MLFEVGAAQTPAGPPYPREILMMQGILDGFSARLVQWLKVPLGLPRISELDGRYAI